MSIQPIPAFVNVPLPGGNTGQEPTALYQLQEAAAMYVNDYTQFSAKNNSIEYANPDTFTANLINFARGLCSNSWSSYTCVGFDPVAMGNQYAQLVFNELRQIILPSTGKSVYDTWISNPPDTSHSAIAHVDAPFQQSSVPGILVPKNPQAVQLPQSVLVQTPITVVPNTTSINTTQGTQNTQVQQKPTGLFLPWIPSLYPDYITQGKVSQGVISDNVGQSQLAQSGGTVGTPAVPTPVSNNPLQSMISAVQNIGLPFGLTWTEIAIGIAGLYALSEMGSGGSGRKSRW